MATILYFSTFGTDDPTRATLPFVTALGALEAGHRAQIVLMGEATYLMKSYLADQVHGVGWPPLQELLDQVIAQGIPLHI